jgi:hypothetical protein
MSASVASTSMWATASVSDTPQRPPERALNEVTSRGKPPTPPHTGEQLAATLALAAAILLEALPLGAWLVVLGIAGTPPTPSALPFWWICLVLLAAWGVASLQRKTPREPAGAGLRGFGLRLLLVLGFFATVLLSWLLSPFAYAGTGPADLVAAIVGDLIAGSGRLGADVMILLLVAYLWWRGILLGRLPLTRDRLYIRFIAGLIAVIVLVAIAGAATGAARTTVSALLAVVLPLEVFIGLVGIALAHLSDTAREHRERQRGSEGEADAGGGISRAWVTTALGISGAVVIGGLVLALLVSYDSIHALADLMRPLGDALGAALYWLIEAVSYLLFLLLNGPITWLKQHSSQSPPAQPPSQPASPPGVHTIPNSQIPHGFEVAAVVIVVAVLVGGLVLVLLWVLHRFNEWSRPEEFEEQRESLGAGDVLGAQWRDLLSGLRRRRGHAGPEEEPLSRGSIRYLFREVLRRAARAGNSRRPSETARDYAERLLASPDAAQGGADTTAPQAAMAELRAAYEATRYGTRAGNAPAPPAVSAAANAVEQWLAREQATAADREGAHNGDGEASGRSRRQSRRRA